ncbi:MAG: HD domain-containing protein [Desulfobacteraceae bacterium]|nr:HD domain-containing protein [Desulfobacteraceae bacterium]
MSEKLWEMKNFLNLREKEFFSPMAALSDNAVRRIQDPYHNPSYRQSFSIDSDRILNCMAYARYINKPQVFSLIKNDHLTYRSLHVQLVSKIARTIGRYLGLNEDLIEAASLGHDIGHPPFGHDGEKFLSSLTQENNAGFFHHNLQSIQFLEQIERNGKGWNLCLQTLDAIVCHNGEIHAKTIKPQWNKTFKNFDTMIKKMEKQERPDSIPMTMEGCVVKIADTISYIGRDMEDAVRLKLIKRKDIPEKCLRLLGNTNGTIVYNLVTDVISNSSQKPYLCFSNKISEALLELKKFNYERIYLNPKIKEHLKGIKDIFRFLFEKYLNDLEKQDRTSFIFKDYLKGLSEDYHTKHSNPQIVRDFIAGMTDSYFINKIPQNMRPKYVDNL